MIAFECPGCTKPLEANRAFAGFETRCLRCGSVLRIPPKSGDHVETLARAGLPKPRPAAPAPRPKPVPPPSPESGNHLENASNPNTTATLEPPAKRRTLKAEAVAEPATRSPVPADESASNKKRKKKHRVIGGSVGGLLLVVVLLVNAFGGSPKKKLAPSPPRKEDPPPAPAAVVEAKKDVTPPPVLQPDVAPMPRAIRPAVEYTLTAAALLQEYGEGPPACNDKYDGKDIFVRGIYHQYSLGKVTMLAGDESSIPLVFTLMLPTEFKSGELLPDPGLRPGQPVLLRGTYRSGCRFADATIELTDSPAERAFVGKSICLDGAVIRSVQMPTGSSPVPAIVLEPHATDSRITITCHFKVSDLENLSKLKPGQKVDVRGRCTGRTYTKVRLDNCAIVTPQEPPGPEVTRIAANAFFTEFEADLLAVPRANLADPAVESLPVTAEGLGHAYQVDPKSANITYRNKPVQLSGYVKERHSATRMLVFQCGTDTPYSVAAIFSPNAFENLPDEKTMVIRGVCSGLFGGYVRIESAEYAETRKDIEVKRTDVEFLPYRIGKEHIVDQLVPGRGKESPVKRMAVRFNGGDEIFVLVQKSGTISGNTLFRENYPEPKWSVVPPRFPPIVRHYRIRDGVVEIGQGYTAGEKEKKEVAEFWEPVLKSGLKRGQSWSAKFPDGKVATYTVAGFAMPQGAQAEHLEIKRVMRDPGDPTRWEETSSTYLKGVGEIRRVVSNKNDRNETIVMSEMRLVSDGQQVELRAQPKK